MSEPAGARRRKIGRSRTSTSRIAQPIIYAALGDKDRTFEALERMFTSEPQRLADYWSHRRWRRFAATDALAALRKKLRLP